ncbi:conserved Plasmodium protein, unknown function [Plasmodium knowlesi strain H]|uniref:Uncharacterized protein n=3 Tax=Plasmodium knowlesi TaxID=5850 RepID=A0A5K1UK32_PLAKH|nr:conserved Plasmodium protein, unknown function [Plasmodium knowlesi strain H]OTN64601.1 Uncharacterized protein PKNOH_S130174300 [Plasmodium knowlesi]CAA9988911.1 conserved Plasmodium protein, unknown function [Plasmodium knowlesi strain H]SBO24756.1 conserved Plasmodium protein, unknown function [Plasmodium knowlesi strain H]SBO28020.1 conserved Plasmodium protein, unknown function [Plasmodium knowlesi strain H]VVS78385.1 conserved Plasmodium protein, unknown function [Plasmodium knowlesi |eukprot:XP_002261258.1 hypothetical protein, conserved in Plasmodium species [Plasmodium knowlesi strain H]
MLLGETEQGNMAHQLPKGDFLDSKEEGYKKTNQIMNDIFQLELKDILKDVSNEKKINDTIDFVNNQINTLNNFINEIAKEKYEYFYKYIEQMNNARKLKKWSSNDLEDVGREYKASYESVREKKNKVLSLIIEKRCLIEIEKVLKLYQVIHVEIKKVCDEIKESNIWGILQADVIDLGVSKREPFHVHGLRQGTFHRSGGEGKYPSLLTNSDFNNMENYLKRISSIKRFISQHGVQNISIVALKVRRMKAYEDAIISVFVQYLSANFFKDENYERKVKHCLNAFKNVHAEKECLKKVINNKIEEANTHILKIKNGGENGKTNLYKLLENCKDGIDQMNYLNEIIKENYYMEEEIRMEKWKREKKTSKNDNSDFNTWEGTHKCNTVHVYTEFYLPYVNLLIRSKINQLVRKEDMLFVLNLVGEFVYIVQKKIDMKGHEKKDILLNLFSKEYEEITFSSMNKLINLVEYLFQKGNIRSAMEYENYYNFPTIFDIKNYVQAFFKELFTHIYYPHIFRKIIVSCNNSLLLLSNNLNNLKQNVNVLIEMDMESKFVRIDYVPKKLKYNLELYLISRQLLRYLICSLARMRTKIVQIKMDTYRQGAFQYGGEASTHMNLFADSSVALENDDPPKSDSQGKDFISLPFEESVEEFFNSQDHLNNYFGDAVVSPHDGVNDDFMEWENQGEKKEKTKKKEAQVNLSFERKDQKEESDVCGKANEPSGFCQNGTEQTRKWVGKNVGMFQISLFSDAKFNSFHLNDSYNISDDDGKYEITPFFIKEKENRKKNYFDLIELEKGLCELNNVVNSCIYECLEPFEKKSFWYFKNNCSALGTPDVFSLFDQLCVNFNEKIVQCVPTYECTHMIKKLINRTLIYLIALSCYYLISGMDMYLFKYYESLQKIANDATEASLHFGYKLCTLFKKSIDMKAGREAYEDVPTFFLPVTFVIFHGGRTIVDSLGITEDKFINILIDHLRNPMQGMDGKGSSGSSQNLNFLVNKFAQSVVKKNEQCGRIASGGERCRSDRPHV